MVSCSPRALGFSQSILHVTRMSSVCHSYVFLCHPYVTRMYSYVTRMSLVCTCLSPVCHSYVIRMSLVCTRMSFVCHWYVLVCHSYVTRLWFYHELFLKLLQSFHIAFVNRCKLFLECFCTAFIMLFIKLLQLNLFNTLPCFNIYFS